MPARHSVLVLALALVSLALANPPRPGATAAIDVSVATVWRASGSARAIDAPALGNPVHLDQWNRNLASTVARAGLGSRVVTQALYGERVKVLAIRGSWAKVAVPNQPTPLDGRGYPGWVPVRQLRTGFSTSGPHRVVTAKRATLHLRGRTLRLSYGTVLPVTGRNAQGNWLVRTPEGAGWIAPSSFHLPSQPTGSSIVAAAKRFLGLRYLWGGVSSWGFDCSGLVWDVFRAHGVTLSRDTGPQSRNGMAVGAGALRPGDLIFYGSPATHVAIVAGGEQ